MGLDGTPLTTLNTVGEIFDVAGGVMAITGGTGELSAASGEASILPLSANNAGASATSGATDFFQETLVYEVNCTIF